jgi:hypothetical protein
MYDFMIVWGCAASSKSNDFGLAILLDWICGPTETIAIMASTTSDMLQLRSMESTFRYFKILKQSSKFLIPGVISKQRLAIVNDDSDEGDLTTVKASIKGVAVQKGTEEEARANLQGAHSKYSRLLLDEMSQMRTAAATARTNLRMGAQDFKFVGLCNPDSINDLAGRFSVPLKGWTSVSPEDTFWETQHGIVRRHDGFRSPAITEKNGAEKYPYLINQKSIDAALADHNQNQDDPAIWTMCRGWPAPQGLSTTIISEGLSKTFRMTEAPVWEGDTIIVAGFDPAFSSGGDDAVLQIGRVGLDITGRLVIGFGETHVLKILASDPLPITYQLIRQLKEFQLQYGFTWDHMGLDDSGTQSVADVLEVETGQKSFRINFGSKASEHPVSIANHEPARTVYRDRITEYYFALAEYAQRNQIRGLPAQALSQFCNRQLVEAKRPKQLEPKKLFKKRNKRSPDHADACACLIGAVREKLGVLPGATKLNPEGMALPQDQGFPMDLVKMYDIDARSDNYLIKL